MAAMAERRIGPAIHPVHAVLLASALPLFLGGLLSDWAYASTYEVQWTNFASWLIAGALVFTGFAALWAFIELLRADRRGGRRMLTFLLLLATFVIGFVDALVHAKDVWAKMPDALILSVITFILALAAVWSGFSSHGAGEVR